MSINSTDSSWLAWPTLIRGGEQPIVGEASYAKTLEGLACGRTPTGCRVRHVLAELILEPDNKYDSNAVRVDIGGMTVGYIARDENIAFHEVIAKAWSEGRAATCRATLIGGWDRGPRNRGSIGVCLDIAQPQQLRHESDRSGPFLPLGPRLTVTGEQNFTATLEPMLGSDGRANITALLSAAPNEAVTVWIDGQEVGKLTPAMTKRFAPLVERVAASGFPTTCVGTLKRTEKRIEVRLELAHPSMLFVDFEDDETAVV